MKRDPETRLIDASELRGRLAELLCDGPTTVFRRPVREPVAEAAEPTKPSPPAPSPQEPEMLTQRNLTPLPYPQASFAVDVPTGASVVVSRPRRPAPLRLLALSTAASVALASLAYSLLGRAAPAQLRASTLAKPTPAVSEASPKAAQTVEGASAAPREHAGQAPPTCARDALVALVEGRRRDAIVAYRMLGGVEPYPAVVRILERELRREQERRTP
jgi:hypothetical protein